MTLRRLGRDPALSEPGFDRREVEPHAAAGEPDVRDAPLGHPGVEGAHGDAEVLGELLIGEEAADHLDRLPLPMAATITRLPALWSPPWLFAHALLGHLRAPGGHHGRWIVEASVAVEPDAGMIFPAIAFQFAGTVAFDGARLHQAAQKRLPAARLTRDSLGTPIGTRARFATPDPDPWFEPWADLRRATMEAMATRVDSPGLRHRFRASPWIAFDPEIRQVAWQALGRPEPDDETASIAGLLRSFASVRGAPPSVPAAHLRLQIYEAALAADLSETVACGLLTPAPVVRQMNQERTRHLGRLAKRGPARVSIPFRPGRSLPPLLGVASTDDLRTVLNAVVFVGVAEPMAGEWLARIGNRDPKLTEAATLAENARRLQEACVEQHQMWISDPGRRLLEAMVAGSRFAWDSRAPWDPAPATP